MTLRKRRALTNAEHQALWRKRNVITLTADAHTIAHRLATMDDQIKLALIVALLNKKLNPPQDGRCRFVKDDGGRARSGIARGGKNSAVGDCVTRAIKIATGKDYREVHDALIAAAVRHAASEESAWSKYANERAKRRGGVRVFHADHGVHHEIFGPYLRDLGWKYTSTKELPRGKGVHLRADELPRGRLIVSLWWDSYLHLTAVIDGEIHDTSDCSDEGRRRILGYWSKQGG
jgi:hypothetical protein